MTPREKILRDAVERAVKGLDDARDYHTTDSREELLVRTLTDVETLIEQADEVKDEPKIGLCGEDLETVKVYRMMQPFIKKRKIFGITVMFRFDPDRVNGCINWMLDKLEQLGSSEQLTKHKRETE